MIVCADELRPKVRSAHSEAPSLLGLIFGATKVDHFASLQHLCSSREKWSGIIWGNGLTRFLVGCQPLTQHPYPINFVILSRMTATPPTPYPTNPHPTVPSHHPVVSSLNSHLPFSGMAWAQELKNQEWRGRVGSVHKKVEWKTSFLNEKWVHFISSYLPLLVLMESAWIWSSGVSFPLCGLGKSLRHQFPVSKIWTYQILSLRFLLLKYSVSLFHGFIIHP